MHIRAFGPEDGQKVMLIHGEHTRWDIFVPAMDKLASEYRILIPELDGFEEPEEAKKDFPGVAQEAQLMENWLKEQGMTQLHGLYGISLGGSIAFQMLSSENLRIERCVIEGAIMPYQRKLAQQAQILLKDGLTSLQKRLPGKVMARLASAGPSTMEELLKTHALMQSLSRETMKQVNRSCLTAPVPEKLSAIGKGAVYWYAQGESQDRYQDIQFIRRAFPQIPVFILGGVGHGELLFHRPEVFGDYLYRVMALEGYLPEMEGAE